MINKKNIDSKASKKSRNIDINNIDINDRQDIIDIIKGEEKRTLTLMIYIATLLS